MFNTGEIVLAKFPFSTLETSKRRPCLILSKGDSPDDYIAAFITSSQVPNYFKFSVRISPHEKNFLQTGLKEESYIRLDKLATLHMSLISGAIGSLPASIDNEVKLKIKQLFNL